MTCAWLALQNLDATTVDKYQCKQVLEQAIARSLELFSFPCTAVSCLALCFAALSVFQFCCMASLKLKPPSLDVWTLTSPSNT